MSNRYPTPLIIDVTQPSTAPPPAPEPPSKWKRVWAFLRKWLVGPIPALLLVVGACILVAVGVKNVHIGGLLGKLLGKSSTTPHKAIEVANSVPPGRLREDGTIIKVGEPDSQGITQAKIVAIEKPGLFSDPRVIKVTPSGASQPIEIQVPDGVKAKDVEHVVVVTPQVLAVTVKSSSSVKAQDVDDLLAKYRRS